MMETIESPIVPVIPPLKWAGGKRWLFQHYENRLPAETERYIEPFFGGGAAFFAFCPKRAILSDVNAELMNLYSFLKLSPGDLFVELQKHHKLHSREHYYGIRAIRPTRDLQGAARTLYLNRTCWNGLYRVNKRGEFNVPIGSKASVVYESDDFDALALRLRDAELDVCDFERSIDKAGAGDFVFADPPYTVKHNFNGFLKYNENIFSWEDQKRLAKCLAAAKKRGADVFLTNADHQSIRDLYKGAFEISRIKRASVISGNSSSRGTTTELVIT